MDTPEWQLEKRFWLEGAPVYETHLHENALMIFPEAGILDRAAVIESLQAAPRWESVEMSEQRTIRGGAFTVLAYASEARRRGDPPYRAFCCSSYIRTDGGWLMTSHQETLR
ncbi:nuclear transport factor 2 family protein [Aquamicrobium soli]|jgi:hypothetical protein|uniref:Nuclear transport factor 2 family protein n=1 Tax=Aquamicrobium soli TaxID=1811518 RepID=A0ABV7K7V2_9HYPH